MAPTLPCARASRAFLMFFPMAAFAAVPVQLEWLESDEDPAVCLMQSVASLRPSMLAESLSGAAPAAEPAFDSTVFAQTSVEVSSAEASAEKPKEVASKPSWLADATDSAEEMTCSMEGLTPGVCAIAALARGPQPQPQPAAGGLRSQQSQQQQQDLDYANVDRLERALFREIDAALAGTHSGFSAAHMAEIEQELSGLFAALPKTQEGKLDHPTVRYALHQRFLRKHAWYVRSLNPVGEAQTPASPGEALRGQVPEHLQRLIESRQGGRGLGRRELAALVATLEHLIQGDLVERVKAAYAAHSLASNATASVNAAAEVIKTYMAHFLSLQHKSGYAVTPEQAREELRSIERGYGGWGSVVENIEQAVGSRQREASLQFSDVLAACQEVMDKFEAVSAQDCQDIKRDLTHMPNGASGSVLLSDLHKKALDGSMLFAESTEYLATLGALERAESGAVSVLVPNYVYSPSNCLGTTSFFDMCCPNECEVMMEKLETKLQKPDVTPAEVEGIVAVLRPEAPLSEASLQELDSLAHAREGRIPLHGFHFAQWMHRAFPGECPKPHFEDFSGARKSAEVPAGEGEYQGVAKLSFIAASRSDLLAEIEQEEEEEEQQKLAAINATQADAAGSDLRIDQLKTIAAQKLGAGGLKVASPLDATSLAQTRLDVSAAEAEDISVSEEQQKQLQATAAGNSGLNVRRLQ